MEKRDLELVVLSDVHLGTYACHAEELLEYLQCINPETLILNGDFLDCWQFKPKYFPPSHMRVIYEILEMAQNGTFVIYITGNHDDILRKFSDMDLGNIKLRDQVLLNIGGKRTWIFHGDFFDLSVKHARWIAKIGGKSYEWIVRINRFVNRMLLGMGRSPMSFSKKIKASVKRAVAFIADFEKAAADVALTEKYDAVICGHIHQPVIKEMRGKNGRTVSYLNSGDWVENLTSLEFEKGSWSIYRHEEAVETSNRLSGTSQYKDAERLKDLGQIASLQLLALREKLRNNRA